ncbi:SIMPL domain-containing protein [Gaiella sp.]|uniref:SIMPL domain-containing protein n=1 Tax=Gaiella sp. TaxID=2663207 RepID=UPI003982FC85
MKRIALAAILLVAAAAVAGVARPEGARAVEGPSQAGDSITVSGNGSVSAVPTTAVFSFGVDSRAATAKGALAANSREMRLVIAAVKAAGGKNVTTQSVNLSQAFGADGAPNGFAASNVVTATIGLDQVGAVIDAAVEAGANQANGPSLGVADQEKLYRQALKAAVADARESAQVLAQAAGRSLGKVTAIVEGGGTYPVPMYEKSAVSDVGVPIEAGTRETTATISVTFALI